MSDYMFNCCPRAIDGKFSEAVDYVEEGGTGILTKARKARTAFKQQRLENE